MELAIICAAVLAGIVQGVIGFGSGIVLMMVLPMFFSLPQSAGLSTAICLFLNAMMVYTYRKHINFKKNYPTRYALYDCMQYNDSFFYGNQSDCDEENFWYFLNHAGSLLFVH